MIIVAVIIVILIIVFFRVRREVRRTSLFPRPRSQGLCYGYTFKFETETESLRRSGSSLKRAAPNLSLSSFVGRTLPSVL